MEIYLSSKFKKSYGNIPKQIKKKAEIKEKLFKKNPFHPSLDTHSLRGKWQACWSFSIDKSYRIVFQFLDATRIKVVFINVGTHEIYK